VTAAVAADRVQSGSTVHGRTTIASRAVRSVVSAVTAEALEVRPSSVSVELNDHDGALVVVARTAIRVTPLGVAEPGSGATLLERLSAAQTTIRERVLRMTGSSIARVDLRITSADLRERRRVA
jgi:hypothetical protein